jgi:hypothetical protein
MLPYWYVRSFSLPTLNLRSSSANTQVIKQSYPALRNLTIIFSLVSCSLQIRSFNLDIQSQDLDTEPEFYTNLQTFFMQVLTTYTSLVPAIRTSRAVLRDGDAITSVFWIALLSVAALGLNIASVAVFSYCAALAPLLSFFGTVVQAVAVLQLATRVESLGAYTEDGQP